MPCYAPIRARRSPDGSVKMLGSVHEAGLLSQSGSFCLPCGRCIGCRLKYSQMWAIRCVHEASMHDQNCVVTFTYADDKVPSNGSLVYRDFQLFMKRLRKLIAPNRVRFFCGGEYGERTARPHFHALLFGYDFPDKVVHAEREGKPRLWTSVCADRCWRLGNCVVGVCDFDSAAYVARYVVKKVYGDLAPAHYGDRLPEFAHMSLKPGIGVPWIERFWKDVSADLCVVHDGKKLFAPRRYVKFLEDLSDCSADDVQSIQLAIRQRMAELRMDNTPKRLHTKARVAAARLGLSRRVL